MSKQQRDKQDAQAARKELVELLGSMVGASTCISKQLNSKARIGFDNITDMLRFLPLSTSSSPVKSVVLEALYLSFKGDGPDTLAGRTARTLSCKTFRKHFQKVYSDI